MMKSFSFLSLASLVSFSISYPTNYKPLVSPETLPSLINLDDLLAGAQTLQNIAYFYSDKNRVFGGRAHNDTVDYIYNELVETGYYDVVKQHQVHLVRSFVERLTVGYMTWKVALMRYSPTANITAEVVLVKNHGCNATDYPANIEGNIALIQRGGCSFADKSVMAASVDAAAAIVYNSFYANLEGSLGAETDPRGPYVPMVGVGREIGLTLFEMVYTFGTVTAELFVNLHEENRTTYNVIAQTKGGDPDNVVTLGAHTDSVVFGPGINDDGSGTISNLVVAKALTRFSVKNAVRFLFWTAEEAGLLGSNYYVASLNASELAKIRLYLNMDMIASPNYALMIYDGDGSAFNETGPKGSAEIEYLFEQYFDSQNLSHVPTAFNGRSDYAAFIELGIPAGGLFTGAEEIMTEEQARLFGGKEGVALDPNYHTAGDDISNLNHDAFLINSKATAFAVATYANSLESIPARDKSFEENTRQ